MLSARQLCAVAIAASLAGLPGTARAAATEANTTVNVNYVYASTLGFGGYSLAGLSADVFTLPLSHTFQLDGNGMALQVTLPIQLGLYSFHATAPGGARISLNQQSLAVVPGVELQVPVADRVLLKPFVNAGAAHAFGVSGTGADAWVYATGVRSVTQWQVGAYTLSVGNAALYAGDSTIGHGFREAYAALEAGVEVRRPLGFNIGRITPDLGVYAATYYYPEPLQFSRYLASPLSVRNQGEVGVSIGSVQSLDMLWLGHTRVGAGYVFGDGLRVWHFVFGFPF